MKNSFFVKTLSGCILGLLVVFAGCGVNFVAGQAKYEKTVRLSTPLEAGSIVIAQTSFGSIKVRGADVSDCNVTAKIRVQAPSEDEAKEIADQVEILLESDGKTLTIKVDKPKLGNNRSVGVSFDIIVPRKTQLDCSTSFGAIKFADIAGDVKGKTSYSSVDCRDVVGAIEVGTSYGNINCSGITSSDIVASSSFGNINIKCSEASDAELSAKITTSYGNIDFDGPNGFSGEVDLSTSFGAIKTDIPVTVKGSLSRDRVKGRVGDGGGKLSLKTSFGSIRIR